MLIIQQRTSEYAEIALICHYANILKGLNRTKVHSSKTDDLLQIKLGTPVHSRQINCAEHSDENYKMQVDNQLLDTVHGPDHLLSSVSQTLQTPRICSQKLHKISNEKVWKMNAMNRIWLWRMGFKFCAKVQSSEEAQRGGRRKRWPQRDRTWMIMWIL